MTRHWDIEDILDDWLGEGPSQIADPPAGQNCWDHGPLPRSALFRRELDRTHDARASA